MLKRGTNKCPKDKTDFEWRMLGHMRIIQEITPKKSSRSFYIYEARCTKCGEYFEVKR